MQEQELVAKQASTPPLPQESFRCWGHATKEKGRKGKERKEKERKRRQEKQKEMRPTRIFFEEEEEEEEKRWKKNHFICK